MRSVFHDRGVTAAHPHVRVEVEGLVKWSGDVDRRGWLGELVGCLRKKMVLWGVRGVYKLIVGLEWGGGGKVVRSVKCGDATNSKLTERVKSRWSMLVSESRSFPASDVLCVDVAGPRYMLLVITMSMRDESGVKSGAQITIVVESH